MRAATFSQFGPLDGLSVADLPNPAPGPHVAIVRVEAAPINPSDVKNIGGAMSQTTLPRIPGRDYAGVVEKGPTDWIGVRVWGTGGDLGFTRDGTHAQRLSVPVASLSRMPNRLSFEEAATVGVNFVTAWCGLHVAACLRPGETVFIIGAGGGVGGAAAQIARPCGARIVGADRTVPPAGSPIFDVTDKLLIDVQDLPAALRDMNDRRGADVVFDTVGGPMFRTALACLDRGGRLVEITAAGQREVSFDLADFYHNESRLLGVDTLKRDAIACEQILTALRPGFESGEYRPAPVAAAFPLSRVSEAYAMVAAGARGRVVLTPQI